MSIDVDKVKNKLEIPQKRLRVINGGGSYGFRDVAGLCLVPDIVIPPKFKVTRI